jgi:hypothetical protein
MGDNRSAASVSPLELSLFASAASGDRLSLVSLACVAREAKFYDPPVPDAEAAASAEAFARLAVMHGHADDKVLLADILCQRAAHASRERSDYFMREAACYLREAVEQGHAAAATHLAALLSILSDGGDERAAVELNQLMERLGPQQAASVREQVGAAFANVQAK